jgi:hypothetical protein
VIDFESPAVERRAAADTGTKAGEWRTEWYGRETWPSTALGVEGAMGAEMMVPGHCVVVRKVGSDLRREYHTSSLTLPDGGVDMRFIAEHTRSVRPHGRPDLTL